MSDHFDAIRKSRKAEISSETALENVSEQYSPNASGVSWLKMLRKTVFYLSFFALLIWNIYCLFAIWPTVLKASAEIPRSTSTDDLSGVFTNMAVYGIYVFALANWFFPTVGLGVIAMAAKVQD
jgi:hypothetical protein